MKPEDNELQQCSAYEIIMLVHELHQMGYEQLRLKSGLSPSGMYWRWHIYPKVFLGDNNLYECKGDGMLFHTLHGSTGQGMPERGEHIDADYILRHHSDIIRMAKCEDKEYAEWFLTLVNHAMDGDFPISYSDYYDATEWLFLKSNENLRYPPFSPADVNDIPDELMIKLALCTFDEDSLAELHDATHDECLTPTKEEVAGVIRKAVRENKGLVSRYESAYEQLLDTRYSDAVEKIPIKNGLHVILKNGESVDLYDRIELFAWGERKY